MVQNVQGLRSLEMVNVVGAYPTETEELLSALRGLTTLCVRNDTAAVKMAPMHCLASMPLLQVPRPVILLCVTPMTAEVQDALVSLTGAASSLR